MVFFPYPAVPHEPAHLLPIGNYQLTVRWVWVGESGGLTGLVSMEKVSARKEGMLVGKEDVPNRLRIEKT